MLNLFKPHILKVLCVVCLCILVIFGINIVENTTESKAVGVLMEVYLTPTSAGNDSNDGTTAATAVRTFEKAKELLAPGGTIWLGASIVIPVRGDVNLSLEGPNGEIGTLKRSASFATTNTAHMIDMTAAAASTRSTLTIENIIIDGNSENYSAGSAIIYARGQNNIIINDGAILQNNKKTTVNGAAIYITGTGSLTMNGGIIQNNQNTAGSGIINVLAGSTFTMNGGIIQDNTASGSLVIVNSSTFNLNKGIIQNNTNTTTSGVIYVLSSSTFNMGDPSYVIDNVSTQPNEEIIIQGNRATANGGAISLNCTAGSTCPTTGSTMTMWAGIIRNNTATSSSSDYGGAGVYNRASTFYMYGGLFSGNNSVNGFGGAIYNASIQYTKTYLLGGTIDSTNTSGRRGDAVYHSSENSADALLHIGGTEILSGIYLAAGMSTVIVDGLTSPILISVADPSDGRVIAVGGENYELTEADAANILISTTGPYQYVVLNENGEIVLTDEEPDYRGVNIYIDGVNGQDNYAGFSPDTAVKTFNAARERLMSGGTIHIVETVTVSNTQVWELPVAVYGNATVRRYTGALGGSALTDSLIEITATGNLSLTNIVLNGGGLDDNPIINNNGALNVAGRVMIGLDDNDGGVYLNTSKFINLTGTPANGSRFNIEGVAESTIAGRIVGAQPTTATNTIASYFHYLPAGARVIPSGNNYILDGAITISTTGLSNLVFGKPLENAKIIYTIGDGEFVSNITDTDFYTSTMVSQLAIAGLVIDSVVRASDTTVEILVEGIPNTISSTPISLIFPETIPMANIDGANDDIPVAGNVSIYPVKNLGADVTVPVLTAGSLGQETLAVTSSIDGTNTGNQTIQYAISTSSIANPNALNWVSTGSFVQLTPETTYYVYARTADNTTNYAGTAKVSAAITTLAIPAELSLSLVNTPVFIPLSSTTTEDSDSIGVLVTTNNSTGYRVDMKADDLDSLTTNDDRLKCSTDSGSYFGPLISNGSLTNNTWGWNVNSTKPLTWNVISTSDTQIAGSLLATGPNNDGAGVDTFTLWFGAKSNSNMPACVYDTTVVISAIANP